jgi:lysophospholipase L1-like esterase
MRKKLALSAVSLLFTLLVAEAALRIVGVGSAGRGSSWFAGGNHPRYLFQPDAASGYALRPGFHGEEIAPGKEFDVPAAVDTRGLRDQPHTAPAQPSVLTLGDSMTFGEGVPADRTFSAVIEREAGIRVDNGGVPGYSSRQMVARLRRLLPVLHPAVVVMTLSPLWDRQRCATPFVYRDGYIVAHSYVDRLELIGGNLYLQETRLPVLGTATAHLKAHSNLLRLAIPALANGAKKLLLHPEKEGVPTAADYEPTVQDLAEARHLAEAQGARFLAVLVDDRGPDYRRDRLAVQERLKTLGVPFVAVQDLLPGADWKRLSYPLDTHWNPAGHEAVGKALAPRIKEMAARHDTGS